MFQTKSFDLSKEQELKKSKNPKQYGWLNFLIIPSVIGFILLLILINVDFTGNKWRQHELTKTTAGQEESDDVLGGLVGKSFRTSVLCGTKENLCTISCMMNSDAKGMSIELESLYKKCGAEMDLTIQSTIFAANKLSKSFLEGNFKIKTLSIINSVLHAIENDALNKPALKTLTNLKISSSTITEMGELTFCGLDALTHFEMTNGVVVLLNADKFLKPLAGTLTSFVFKQMGFARKYNPMAWFDGHDLIKLEVVDLSGNNFPDTLGEKAFTRLVNVKRLILKGCSIRQFGKNTFGKVMETLEYLDLSQNHLISLSTDFLERASDRNVLISALYNFFDCSCDTNDYVEVIALNNVHFEFEPKCVTPAKHEDKLIKDIKNCCENDLEKCPDEEEPAATTIQTIPTTLSNPSDSTDDPNDVVLACNIDGILQYLHIKNNESILFQVVDLSPTNVLIQLNDFHEEFQLIYFRINSQSDHYSSLIISAKKTRIKNLSPSDDYIFCAVTQVFSPFNCRSHRTMGIVKAKAWLSTSDMPLFITLSIFGVILCLLIGAGIIFFTIRWRPTLLRNSERLIRINTNSKQVLLSKDNPAPLSTSELYEALRTYASLYSIPMVDSNPHDYMEFIGSVDLSQTIYSGLDFSDNQPPVERAPAMPPINRNRQFSTQSTIPAHDNTSLESISEVSEFDEHDYQSLDQYHEIYQ